MGRRAKTGNGLATSRGTASGEVRPEAFELSPDLGDGRDQAQRLELAVWTTSFPSVNSTPRMCFGNRLWPSRWREGSFASLRRAARLRRMSAMPSIATESVRRSEPTRMGWTGRAPAPNHSEDEWGA